MGSLFQVSSQPYPSGLDLTAAGFPPVPHLISSLVFNCLDNVDLPLCLRRAVPSTHTSGANIIYCSHASSDGEHASSKLWNCKFSADDNWEQLLSYVYLPALASEDTYLAARHGEVTSKLDGLYRFQVMAWVPMLRDQPQDFAKCVWRSLCPTPLCPPHAL